MHLYICIVIIITICYYIVLEGINNNKYNSLGEIRYRYKGIFQK